MTTPFNLVEGQKKKVIFTAKDCNYCDSLLSIDEIQQKVSTGEIVEKKCGSETPEQIQNSKEANANQITEFPTVAEMEMKEGKVHMCELDKTTGKLAKCREYKIPVAEESKPEPQKQVVKEDDSD